MGYEQVYNNEIKERYKELRDLGIFTVGNIVGLLNKWLNMVGYDNLKQDLEIYNQTPSYRASNINNEYWQLTRMQLTGEEKVYDETKSYSIGEICYIDGGNPYYVFTCLKECTGIPPFVNKYDKKPIYCGYYNSPIRVKNWLINRIEFLDRYFEYTK